MPNGKLPIPLADLRFVPDAEFDVSGITRDGRTPYPFQKIGAGGIALVPRMILADEVGLGKTIQWLMGVKKLRDLRHIRRAVLVAKPTLVHQWASEAESWFPGGFTIQIIEGTRAQRHKLYQKIIRTDGQPWRHVDLVLLSYPTARVDTEQILQMPYEAVGLDEASQIRNPAAAQTQAIYRICQDPKVERVVAITATPVQSRLEEYHSIMTAVDPTVFGDRAQFLQEYCLVERFPIERKHFTTWVENITGYKNLPRFKEAIKGHVLQRTIEDVGAQMPEMVIQDRWLDMKDGQMARYRQLEDGYLDVKGYEHIPLEGAQQLLRLAQVANATQILFPEKSSAKLDELEDMLRNEMRGQQIVIFSRYVEMLQLVRQEVLTPLKIKHGLIIGGERDKSQIEATRLRFQRNEIQVVLLSTAGEEGLNLGAGKYLICMDVLYNEGRMRQIYGRIRRLSSVNQTVIVYRLLCRNTVEDGFLKLLQKRGALIDYLDSPEKLDPQQLRELMSVVNKRIDLLK